MGIDGLNGFQFWVAEDVDAAIPISEEEHVVIIVPGDLIDLKLELFLCFGAMRLCVNEGDDIILVPHRNGLSIRAPTDVDVLPFGVDGGNALGGAHVPDADGFVPGRSDKEVGVAGMPAELIHAVTMAPVVVLFYQPVLLEQEDAGGLIEGSGREAAAAAAPGHGVHLGAVRRELAAARVGAEQLLHGLHVGRQRHARPAAPSRSLVVFKL